MITNQLLDNRYQTIKKLHQTNLSITFQGKDTRKFDRPCLIKQLKITPYNPQQQQDLKQRFEQEAQTLAKLGEHPQIPDLSAYFSENNQFYLVQEWIEGSNLEQKVQQQGKLTETEVKDILTKLLPVLEFIHNQHQIIHRDIKPSNIMLNSQNLPILIDFGIVKEIVATTNAQIPATIIGTPGFMAPEQTSGKPTFASDIYSLGITAIYLLTGKLPRSKFSWRSDAPNISQEFADILDKSIAENLSDRYSTATEILTAIKKLQPLPATRPSSDPSQNNPPQPANSRLLKIEIVVGIIAIIVGIITQVTDLFDKFTKPPQTPEIKTQKMLEAATKKAESAISKAKAATEKNKLETARYELKIAIQEIENIPEGKGIDNQIKAKESEYTGIINQINQGLKKQPCYELLWPTNDCQEYPVKLD